MAELIAIRRMHADDLPAADRLREQANWNQTLGDWQRVLSWEPEGCFVAEHQGAVVGTVTATRYGSRLAWIGMMLVDQAMRSRGIGRQMLNQALEWLERDEGIACVGLDATPQGKLLYDTMSFVDAYTLQRRQGDAPALEPSPHVEVLQSPDIDVLLEIDPPALAVDRMRISRDLHMAHPDGCYVVRVTGEVV